MMRRMIGAACLALALLAPVAAADAPASSSVAGVAPCRFEDGSGQARCVWDARHRGNGIGRSLIVTRVGDRETFVYVSHARAHRLVSAWRGSRCAS